VEPPDVQIKLFNSAYVKVETLMKVLLEEVLENDEVLRIDHKFYVSDGAKIWIGS